MKFYHGGPAGRQQGSYLLPPCQTGAPCLSDFGAEGVHRRDRVYLTTDYRAAVMYAAGWRDGVVYCCAPIGEPEPDPDCTFEDLSWQCPKARIKRIIKPKRRDLEKARAVLADAYRKGHHEQPTG